MTDGNATITTKELRPGEPCPVCAREISSWRGRQINSTQTIEGETCWLYTDEIEVAGLKNDIVGNVVLIDHK